MNRYEVFIKQYISGKKGLDTDTISSDANMFEEHYIDSLGVFNMLLEVENEFGIRFNEQDMTNKKMATIRGAAEIIATKRAQ